MEIMRVKFRNEDRAAPLRHEARAVLAGLGANADAVDDVLLVISELVQNVCLHTAGGGTLVLRAGTAGVRVEVTDSDPAPPREQQPDPMRIGGRGLVLVGALALRWGTDPVAAGKTVWAEMPLPVAAAAA